MRLDGKTNNPIVVENPFVSFFKAVGKMGYAAFYAYSRNVFMGDLVVDSD